MSYLLIAVSINSLQVNIATMNDNSDSSTKTDAQLSPSQKVKLISLVSMLGICIILSFFEYREEGVREQRANSTSLATSTANSGVSEAHEDLLRAMKRELQLINESSTRQSDDIKRLMDRLNHLGSRVKTLSDMEKQRIENADFPNNIATFPERDRSK
jgi:hypothetical protein